ncbi:MAG: hypothetical protein GY798_32955 [Hyphomicrobiales bacterium]|nr:hypothetical protein [Hyphomicrobiales bacterium]
MPGDGIDAAALPLARLPVDNLIDKCREQGIEPLRCVNMRSVPEPIENLNRATPEFP